MFTSLKISSGRSIDVVDIDKLSQHHERANKNEQCFSKINWNGKKVTWSRPGVVCMEPIHAEDETTGANKIFSGCRLFLLCLLSPSPRLKKDHFSLGAIHKGRPHREGGRGVPQKQT